MKKIKFSDYGVHRTASLFAIAILTVLTSCSEKKPLELKPVKTNIVNENSDVYTQSMIKESICEFIEIIDGTYSMVPINEGKDWRIDVKFKSIKKADKTDEFEISSSGYTPGGTGLYLVDKAGTIIEEWGGVGQFELVNKDVLIEYLKTGEGECMLRFENDAYKFEKYLKTPEEIAGFIVKTSAYRKTAENTAVQSNAVSSSSNEGDEEEAVTENSGNTNWDKILADYESYTDKYIKLLKKANAGDASAMTEYMEMLEKAQEFQESLSDANDDLTPAQLQKFTKIQMKLANAAAGL